MEETRIIDFAEAYEVQVEALPMGADLLGGKFKVERQIGSGGFGITYLAQDIYLERNVVIKECFPEAFSFRFGNMVKVNSPRHEAQYRKTVEMFMREARSIAKMRHPNIVSVHQVFEENETAYMVLDLIEGRDLLDIISDDHDLLKPDQVSAMLVKLLDAVELVHRHDLLHRDISPDNILLDKWGSPSLIDFGAAREEASTKTNEASTMLVVKDGYSPHEFYVSGGKQGPCSDLYALGATMYHLISGEAPPNSQTRVSELTSTGTDPYEPLAGRFPQYEIAFLEAIDIAMSVPPKDRHQSAKDWLSLIEQEGKQVKIVDIPESKSLSKTLSELVSETNKHVMTAPREPVQEQAPKPAAATKTTTFSPEWVEEFNRETSEVARRQREQEQAEAAAARMAEAAQIAKEARLAEEARLAQEAKLDAQRKLEAENAILPRNLLDWVSRSKPG